MSKPRISALSTKENSDLIQRCSFCLLFRIPLFVTVKSALKHQVIMKRIPAGAEGYWGGVEWSQDDTYGNNGAAQVSLTPPLLPLSLEANI